MRVPGSKRTGRVSEKLDVVRERPSLQAMRVILGGKDVARASAMTQQLANSHVDSKVPVGVVGPVGCHRLIERELPFLQVAESRSR